MMDMLALRVPEDDAVYIFGAADGTLQGMEDATQEAEALARGRYSKPWREALDLPEDAPDEAVGQALLALPEDEREALEREVEASVDLGEIATPDDLVARYSKFFCEAVRAWEGVEDTEGNALPCNHETRRDFPTEAKVRVVSAFLRERLRIAGERGNGSGPPSTSSPQEGASSETETAPAS